MLLSMAVIIMPSITSLIAKLRHDFPDLTFLEGTDFHWAPQQKTVWFVPGVKSELLLHELAHALLGHKEYKRDIQLVEMERDAWKYAQDTLSGTYHITIEDNIIEDALDSYRDWLHARSTCPSCQATGIQKKQRLYICIACESSWQVNEARTCELRRYLKTSA
jgi:hypothetical protein